ncbi:MAG TPA: peptide deformylase [Pirellulaceae bacterium]|nr:peptide deformylase [Pirellulaceae bacterium]
MPLKIIPYPHPTLRHVSKAIRRVDADLKKMVREMFDLMYEAKGVGLAANQVDLPLRLFIANLEAEAGKGEELVFINPVISRPKGSEEAEEGCLSLPGLYGDVVRPKTVRINAYNLSGEELVADVSGMLARVVQHELDHLDGVLFVDRMSSTKKADVLDTLHEFELDFDSRRGVGEIPDDATLAERLRQWESRYC